MKKKYPELLEFGRNLLDKESLNDGTSYISSSAKSFIGADRCSIFIYDTQEDRLWTTLSDGTEKITIPFDLGVVGHTFKIEKPVLVNDPYDNIHFLSDVDVQTGYYTRNLLTSPIFNSRREIIGVIQLLNRQFKFKVQHLEF